MANKFFAASALALCVMGGLNMAHAQDGTVTFTGSITDNTCAIATDSKDITVDFGQIATKPGTSPTRRFNINLTNCPASMTTAHVVVTAEKSSSPNADSAGSIKDIIAGGSESAQAYWRLTSPAGLEYRTDGSDGLDFPVTEGDNALPQQAQLIQMGTSLGGTGAEIGTHTGEATYTITYQ